MHTDKFACCIKTNELNLLTIWINPTTSYWTPCHKPVTMLDAGDSVRNETEVMLCWCPLQTQSSQRAENHTSDYDRAHDLFWKEQDRRKHSINLWFPTRDPKHFTAPRPAPRTLLGIFNLQQKTQGHLSDTVGHTITDYLTDKSASISFGLETACVSSIFVPIFPWIHGILSTDSLFLGLADTTTNL